MTQNRFMAVGSGMGPDTAAPVLSAASGGLRSTFMSWSCDPSKIELTAFVNGSPFERLPRPISAYRLAKAERSPRCSGWPLTVLICTKTDLPNRDPASNLFLDPCCLTSIGAFVI